MFLSNENKVRRILAPAGVRINGSNPWDIQVKNKNFYNRVMAQGSLGLGESYMDGWWECEAIDQFISRVLRSGSTDNVAKNPTDYLRLLKAKLWNMQSLKRAGKDVPKHYDKGDDLFFSFLDPYHQYSCAYFKDTNDLNKAQEDKMDLICRKMGLDKLHLPELCCVLDIGCGWGGLVEYMTRNYECYALGVTISSNQADYADKRFSGIKATVWQEDYRNLPKKLEYQPAHKVVSVGMFEHVGAKNHRTFMEVVRKCISEDGLFLLHTIGTNKSSRVNDPWLDKYIFPGSLIPSADQITRAIDGLFVVEDWHNFGVHYANTLRAWMVNFNQAWPTLRINPHYDERFYRMWKYYLLSCAGSFDARHNHLWQIVLSPKGVPDGYTSVR